jgi:hypothetical protein
MVELHIDHCHKFEEKANEETKPAGWLGVRKTEKEKGSSYIV